MMLKRFISIFLCAVLCACALPLLALADEESSQTPALPSSPELVAGYAAVAYCVEYDQFLLEDRIDETVAPCVAAKLVTGMVAYDIVKEQGLSIDTLEVTVSAEAVATAGDVIDIRVPILGLRAGSVYYCKDLLQSLFVASANDAATTLASFLGTEYLGGGTSAFVARMNEKCDELGLTKTRFAHPAGLDEIGQYSTPREVALIAAAFYKYDELVKLSDVASFSLKKVDSTGGGSTVINKNYLKNNKYVAGYLNKNAIGIIAGQNTISGDYCLITATQKDGISYIFVVMCAPSLIVESDAEGKKTYRFDDVNAYTEMTKIIDWARSSFRICDVADPSVMVAELRVEIGVSDHVMIVPREKVSKLVLFVDGVELETKVDFDTELVYKTENNGSTFDTVKAPIKKNQKVGVITYSYNGETIAVVDAVARENVDSNAAKSIFDTIKGILFSKTALIILCVIGGIIVLYALFAFTMWIIRLVKKLKGDPKPKKKKKKVKPVDENATTRELK